MLSFQNLTPLSDQPKAECFVWNKATLILCMQIKENPLYKGGWLTIGSARREEMNQSTPNHGLALRWSTLAASPIEWGEEDVPESNIRPRVVLDTQVWLSSRMEVEEATFAEGIMLYPRGESRTIALEGTGNLADFRINRSETRRDKQGTCAKPVSWVHKRLDHVTLEDPCLDDYSI